MWGCCLCFCWFFCFLYVYCCFCRRTRWAVGGGTGGGAEVSPQARFADYTTSQLGAPARGMVTCSNAAQVSAVVRAALRWDVPLFVVGGGSNLVVGDESTGVQCHELVMLRQTAGEGTICGWCASRRAR
ncbi:MAG: FAD-binding protein [Lawsonella clevelandensis]